MAESDRRIAVRENGTWTPTLTFETPGDLAVTYSVRDGFYERIGQLVVVRAEIVTTAFTYLTSLGTLRVTGLPYPAGGSSGTRHVGFMECSGWTHADIRSLAARIDGGDSHVRLRGSRSGNTIVSMGVAEFPSGSTISMGLTVPYTVSD